MLILLNRKKTEKLFLKIKNSEKYNYTKQEKKHRKK